MSFKQIPSAVSLGNMALAMVSESKTITSVDDSGKNAQAIRTWYKPIVSRLLEMHHWGLATKRATPVAVSNLRSTEWLYAYAPPDDMAFPVTMTLESGVSTVSYYRGLSGLIAMTYGRPIFLFNNGTIYSNFAGDLEYVSYDITEADFNATFADIVTTMLASKLALELPKDYELSQAFADEATAKINMAITANLNSGNRQYGQVTSEAELARGSMVGHNWDYFPLSPGA
jgi:hypothetical protein